MKKELVLGNGRDLGTVALVAGLCGMYAGVLVSASSILASLDQNDSGALGLTLQIVALVFNLIAIYVAAVVITNAVDTVLAGRLRHLALLRLLGARSHELRQVVMRATGAIGLVAAVIGAVLGVAITWIARVLLVHNGTLPPLDYPVTSPVLILPMLTIGGVALICGRVGSRRVLTVTPAEAMTETAAETPTLRRGVARKVFAVLVMATGGLILLLAAWTGEHYAGYGFLLAFVGAITLTTGLLIGARFVVPWLVATTGRLLGDSPASRIARRNAVLDPARTTRSTMGLLLGVAIVTTIAAGTGALQQAVDGWHQLTPADQVLAHQVLSVAGNVTSGIVIVSCLISIIGFISTMSLTVIQRRRELGLLRAVGFTTSQVRSMITRESAALAGTAVLCGLLLGVLLGSVGAQSLVGLQTNGFVWGTPWPFLAVVAAAGVALVLVAALPPARRATGVPVVAALRIDS